MQMQNAPRVRWEWISEAWDLFTRQWSTWVLMILVFYLIALAVYLPFIGVIAMMAPTVPQGDEIPTAPVFPVALLALYPVIYLALLSAVAWLMGGLYHAAFKQLRGEQIAVGDLFSGGRYFGRMLGALFLIAIAAGIGGIFCLIPGLIVYGMTMLTYPMIVEGGKGTIDAISASIEVTKRDWIMFTLFAVAVYLLASLGVIACGVGVLATMPLLPLTQALAYRDLVGMRGAQSSAQFMPPPPPDYRTSMPSYTSAPPPQPWAEPAPTTCPHCGATLTRAAKFCNQCGNMLRPN
jgi:hypothetical protein